MSSARGGDGGTQPLGVETTPSKGATTEGVTGCAPLVTSACDARPVCQSCENIRLPLAWTLSVIFFQPATCSSEYMPGAPYHPRPVMEIVVASEIMKPPSDARCS